MEKIKKILNTIWQFKGWIILNVVILSAILIGFNYKKIYKAVKKIKNVEVEDILKIDEYKTKYYLKINSNKTSNAYNGEEMRKNGVNTNKFKDLMGNDVEISVNETEIKIKANEQNLIYTIPKKEYTLSLNCFTDFIEKYKQGLINDKKYIVKSYEENNNIFLEIVYNAEINYYNNKVKTSKLVVNKTTQKPVSITNLDKDLNIVSKIDYINFEY